MKALIACCVLLAACASAPPRAMDDLLDTPVASVERRFGPGSYARCYQISDGRFVNLGVDDEDPTRFWSVELADVSDCTTTMPPLIEMPSKFNIGVDLGDPIEKALSVLGQPDSVLKQPPEGSSDEIVLRFQRRGGIEYMYRCKAPPDCGSVTSIFARNGKVSAISISYSD